MTLQILHLKRSLLRISSLVALFNRYEQTFFRCITAMQGKRNVKQYKAIGYLTISIA